MSDSEQLELFSVEEHDEGTQYLEGYIRDVSKKMELAEILDRYDVVSASHGENPYIVVAEKSSHAPTQLADTVAVGPELGYSSPSPWTAWTREEHNPKLRDKLGTTEYYRMKRVDGMIRAALRVFKTPPLAAHWFVEPGGRAPSKRDQNAAEFIEDNLFEGLNVSWRCLLEDILTMCEYGYSMFEKVYALRSDGKIVYKKLAPRHPADVQEFIYDSNGGPNGVMMEKTEMTGFSGEGIWIPIDKLVIFSLEPEAGDLRGISILRSAYMHYTYKTTLYKIDAIQKERHGIGVPVIKLPPGFSVQDKKVAENLGRNLRTNERAHVTLPPNWELLFAKLEGQPVDCMKSIDHHNMMIMANVLAPFLTEPNTAKESLETFYKATRYIADTVTDTFNMHCIRQLIDLNYVRVKYPKLRARRIGEWEDSRTMSFTLRNLSGAGFIRPDDELEKFLRKEMDLTPIDEATVRETKTPQLPAGPPKVGPPRQALPNAKPPSSTGGQDRRGS